MILFQKRSNNRRELLSEQVVGIVELICVLMLVGGRILGAGGDGGKGADNQNERGGNGKNGNSGLGLRYPATIRVLVVELSLVAAAEAAVAAVPMNTDKWDDELAFWWRRRWWCGKPSEFWWKVVDSWGSRWSWLMVLHIWWWFRWRLVAMKRKQEVVAVDRWR